MRRYGIGFVLISPFVVAVITIVTSPHSLQAILAAGWGDPASSVHFNIFFWGMIVTGAMASMTWAARNSEE